MSISLKIVFASSAYKEFGDDDSRNPQGLYELRGCKWYTRDRPKNIFFISGNSLDIMNPPSG